MKKYLCLSLCVLMVFGLVSCGKSSVKGKWEFGGNVYEFNDDGTFSLQINVLSRTGTYAVEDGIITLSYTSLLGLNTTTELEYTLKGKTLTLTGDVFLLGAMSTTVEFTKAK